MALLPDPEPRQRQHVVISVDDHVIEPPDMFEGRLPAAWATVPPKSSRPTMGGRSGAKRAGNTPASV